MANNIVLKTYKGGSVTPLDDAIIQQTVIATNGIFKGCNVTYARGNVLHVSQGFGMVKGRFFEVYDCEVGVILNSGSGTLQGRLYIHMDLSNADEPIQLLTETASVLTDLTGDEDVNYNNTSYDLELATFGVTRTGITNLVTAFEKITGASGSGGASSLQRSTAYYKGDFVTCKNAPGWVTLYCITAGETAAAEPVEYAGIAQVGDTVQDGTCVFIARDVVGEIDVLKDLFTDTETSIAGLEDGLQELWEEVIKQAESQDDPIGTIRFMPSTNADENWLKCDGSYINEADYPELVASLGKLMPSGDKFCLLSNGEVPSQISNGVVYGGRLWVYSFSARKLYGIALDGTGAVKAIPVTSTSPYFADFIAPSTAKPIALSIVPHHSGNKAKLFLAQIIASGGNNNVQAEYSWVSYFLVFSAEFSGEESTLAVEPPFKTILKETGTGNMASYYYYPQFNPTLYVPYVIAKMVSGVETYYCAIGTRYYTYGSSSPGALTWEDGSETAKLIYTSITTDDSNFKNQRLCYSGKSMGELVSVYASTSSSRYYICDHQGGDFLERIVQRVGSIPAQPKALRVAAYARVSSGKDAMLHSLSAQISYYSDLIQNHPGWLYCGVFTDEALTGTKENRAEFQRLLAECRAGNIDLIITKSISRFARNTVVLLQTVRELKSMGVDVYFEEQNIHSMSADGELMLTILASYAQEESLSASENQKWRIRKNFEDGKPWSGQVLGYRYEDGVYIVKPDEAKVVREIFADYLSGMGIEAIMKKLNAEGRTTRNGHSWGRSCVRKVLGNYAYTGNLLLQTTFRENHITKKTLPNRGELPMYHIDNSHEAIVSMEDYRAVQAEMARRSAKHNKTTHGPVKYPFTSMIVCGICGKGYRRKMTRTGPVWICSTYNVYGKAACPSKQIPEGTLEKVTAEVLGLDAFDAKALHDKITAIRAEKSNTLVFLFKDGTQTVKRWADRSRAESWTPEMRAAASEYAKKGQAIRSCQQQEQ